MRIGINEITAMMKRQNIRTGGSAYIPRILAQVHDIPHKIMANSRRMYS
jgi:hypothetical protein